MEQTQGQIDGLKRTTEQTAEMTVQLIQMNGKAIAAIEELQQEMREVKLEIHEVKQEIHEVKQEMREGFKAVNANFERLFSEMNKVKEESNISAKTWRLEKIE